MGELCTSIMTRPSNVAQLFNIRLIPPTVALGIGGPTARPPYHASVFATNPAGLSKPDSIAFNATNIFVGYGNGGDPAGCCGAMSDIVTYDLFGTKVHDLTIAGHNDGLKINPITGDLWALQNEDANATLIVINVNTYATATSVLGTGPHGGGYDDLVFDGQNVFISASNPPNNPNTAPAIVNIGQNVAELTPILMGNDTATNVKTRGLVTLNLQDPDSMTFGGSVADLVMTSQGDGELVLVRHPGLACQQNILVPLTSKAAGKTIGSTQADDTVFASTSQGRLLVADKSLGKVYSITAGRFEPGTFYSAISVFVPPTAANPTQSFVGRTDLNTGFVDPIVTGMSAPGGMAFVPVGGKTPPVHPTIDKCP
jgi:hypothetical protein